MSFRSRLRLFLLPWLRKAPRLKQFLGEADVNLDLLRHTIAQIIPAVIQPSPRNLTVAVTARCNLRCIGCRYGREFMQGSQLPWPIMSQLIHDASDVGMESIRLYGGEPLLHPDLTKMVELSVSRGMRTLLTTNGILLGKKIEELHSAGLRNISIGFYGYEDEYDQYTQTGKKFATLERSIATVREKFGSDIRMQLNWLLMRQSCNISSVDAVWRFAKKYDMLVQVDLVHYSLPYFTEGPDRMLQFRDRDQSNIDKVVAKLLALKTSDPKRMQQSDIGLASIPEWLLRGPDMRVPCDRYQMLWVGADGTVQLCYVCYSLGNLHHRRLPEMLFGEAHKKAALGAFEVSCSNCHCSYDLRIQKHLASRKHYRNRLEP
jgi:molybdenum cofactor biosynthesis enzyme MoaA